MARFFVADDLCVGLNIFVPSRRTSYRVDSIKDGRVGYRCWDGQNPGGRDGEMSLETFTSGLEEMFAVIEGDP